MKRIPQQSIKGATDEATTVLRSLLYLVEVERQADLFGRSFSDAMIAALDGDATETWRHLQSAMFAGIVVNRVVKRQDVRRVLGLPDHESESPILHLYTLRNHLEHIDERIKRVLNSPDVASVADWYLFDRALIVTPEDAAKQPRALRAFCPELGVLFFDREPLNMFLLDLDMLRLKHNAREVQVELHAELSGRSLFGGGQLAPMSSDASQVQGWRDERARLIAEMAAPPVTNPSVKVWLQVEEPADLETTAADGV